MSNQVAPDEFESVEIGEEKPSEPQRRRVRLFGQPARQAKPADEPAPKADKMKITPLGPVDHYAAADAYADNLSRS